MSSVIILFIKGNGNEKFILIAATLGEYRKDNPV
jgi:hypothetical protein